MCIEEVVKDLEKVLEKSNSVYFSYAWREKLGEIGELLEVESRYSKLVNWIDKEIIFCNNTKNVFCPADKNESTTISSVKMYCELMQRLAILVHCKMLLLDGKTTTKMRENIEYTLCKLYGINYSEEFGQYL